MQHGSEPAPSSPPAFTNARSNSIAFLNVRDAIESFAVFPLA